MSHPTQQPLRIALIDTSADYRSQAGHSFDIWIHQPLALMYLATYLRERGSTPCEVRVVNLGVDCRSQEQLEAFLDGFSPRIVGLRGLTSTADQLHETARVAKGRGYPTVVAGGPYPSTSPEEVLEDRNIDLADRKSVV